METALKRCLHCMEEYDDRYECCPLCGYRAGEPGNPRPSLEEGTILLGRYIVGTLRKQKDCDFLYVGYDALFERKVFLQEFFPPRCVTRSSGGDVHVLAGMETMYADNLERFITQFKQLIRLYKEEDITSIYSCFKANGTAYAAMRYCEEETLSQWLAHSKALDEWEAMNCLSQAAEALKKIHALGLIHGGVGVDAFWRKGSGGLVLKDFAEPRHNCGSSGLRDYGCAGPWTDIHDLAVMFAVLLLNDEEFSREQLFDRLADRNSPLPARVVWAMRNALDDDFTKRPKSLEEFSRQMFGDSVTRRLTFPPEIRERKFWPGNAVKGADGPHSRKSHGKRWLAGTAVLVVLAVLFGICLSKWHRPYETGVLETEREKITGSETTGEKTSIKETAETATPGNAG